MIVQSPAYSRHANTPFLPDFTPATAIETIGLVAANDCTTGARPNLLEKRRRRAARLAVRRG